jgi:phage terminase small subunit
MATLTKKQQKFIDEYFACGMNASEAARRAGYSPETAYSIGYENLRKPEIREVIDRMFRENSMPADEVLARLSDVGRSDIGDITTEDGVLDMRKARAAGKTGLIRSIKQTTITSEDSETHIIEVKLHDKLKSLELLGRYHTLFTDRVKIDDWRSQAIDDIKAGLIDYPSLAEAFDDSLAQELFKQAGVKVVVNE